MGSSFIHLIRTDSNEFFLMAMKKQKRTDNQKLESN